MAPPWAPPVHLTYRRQGASHHSPDSPMFNSIQLRQHGVAGFWTGLWHGMICPIAFFISLFNREVSMYEVHNNGNWYNFGFLIGAGAWGILRPSRRSKDR